MFLCCATCIWIWANTQPSFQNGSRRNSHLLSGDWRLSAARTYWTDAPHPPRATGASSKMQLIMFMRNCMVVPCTFRTPRGLACSIEADDAGNASVCKAQLSSRCLLLPSEFMVAGKHGSSTHFVPSSSLFPSSLFSGLLALGKWVELCHLYSTYLMYLCCRQVSDMWKLFVLVEQAWSTVYTTSTSIDIITCQQNLPLVTGELFDSQQEELNRFYICYRASFCCFS